MGRIPFTDLTLEKQIHYLTQLASANSAAIVQIMVGLNAPPEIIKHFYTGVIASDSLDELIQQAQSNIVSQKTH